MKLKFKKTVENARVPTLSQGKTPAFELYAILDEDKVLFPGDIKLFRTGIAFSMEEREFPDMSAMILPHEELVREKGIYLANNIALIGGDYKGEITVALINNSKVMRTISDGEKIARLIVTRVQVPTVTAGQPEQETPGVTS